MWDRLILAWLKKEKRFVSNRVEEIKINAWSFNNGGNACKRLNVR